MSLTLPALLVAITIELIESTEDLSNLSLSEERKMRRKWSDYGAWYEKRSTIGPHPADVDDYGNRIKGKWIDYVVWNRSRSTIGPHPADVDDYGNRVTSKWDDYVLWNEKRSTIGPHPADVDEYGNRVTSKWDDYVLWNEKRSTIGPHPADVDEYGNKKPSYYVGNPKIGTVAPETSDVDDNSDKIPSKGKWDDYVVWNQKGSTIGPHPADVDDYGNKIPSRGKWDDYVLWNEKRSTIGPHPADVDDYGDKIPPDNKLYYDDYTDTGHRGKFFDVQGTLLQKYPYECMQALDGRSSVNSPLSALRPIGLLGLGAEGTTLSQILRAIGVSSKSKIRSYFKNIRELQAHGVYMASRVFVHNKRPLHSYFKSEAGCLFETCIARTNFGDRGKVVSEVNSWVKRQTNNNVEGIISASDIPSNTGALIVDAIYFSCHWRYPFSHIRGGTFYGTQNSRSASMMYNIREYKYGHSRELGSQVIEIPYRDHDMKLIIVLPHENNNIGSLIQQLKLAPDLINDVKMKTRKVHLEIPKFRIETSINVNSLYQRLGLSELLSGGRGLTELLLDETCHVERAVQKAFIIVDEEGTEAGAAGYMASRPQDKPKHKGVVFKANRPFIFYITIQQQQIISGVLQ